MMKKDERERRLDSQRMERERGKVRSVTSAVEKKNCEKDTDCR